MKYAAVAMISSFDNEINQRVVQIDSGTTWKEVLAKALADGIFGNPNKDRDASWIMSLPDEFDRARAELNAAEMDIKITFFSAQQDNKCKQGEDMSDFQKALKENNITEDTLLLWLKSESVFWALRNASQYPSGEDTDDHRRDLQNFINSL